MARDSNPRKAGMRIRDAAHLKRVRLLRCVRCLDNQGSDPAHIRFSSAKHGKVNPGVGQKPHDRHVLPLCRRCHDLQHKGNEEDFWGHYDPIELAEELYAASGDINEEDRIVEKAFRLQWGVVK